MIENKRMDWFDLNLHTEKKLTLKAGTISDPGWKVYDGEKLLGHVQIPITELLISSELGTKIERDILEFVKDQEGEWNALSELGGYSSSQRNIIAQRLARQGLIKIQRSGNKLFVTNIENTEPLENKWKYNCTTCGKQIIRKTTVHLDVVTCNQTCLNGYYQNMKDASVKRLLTKMKPGIWYQTKEIAKHAKHRERLGRLLELGLVEKKKEKTSVFWRIIKQDQQD